MFNIVKKEIEWGGRKLTLETGQIARQSDGAVKVTYGDAVILCTVVAKKSPLDGVDFLPLTVHYQEKTFAAGKIPGGFFKREARPPEFAVLTSRLIDRPLRPCFRKGYFNDTQVICTVLSYDLDIIPDIPALIGASAALAISGIPFDQIIGGSRVGLRDGEYILNPSFEDLNDSELDLVVAGTKNSVLMVESEAKILSEDDMLNAVKFGHDQIQPVIKAIEELKSEVGNEIWEVIEQDNSELKKFIASEGESSFREAYKIQDKQERSTRLEQIREELIGKIEEKQGEEFVEATSNSLIKDLEKTIVRDDILNNKVRIDGRKEDEIRQIESSVSILPKTHGSALFTRGETQAIVVNTLGTNQDMQIVDGLEGEYKERFMLHYNFPPYSVGESTPLRAPGRREIGHGKLAWRALNAVLPDIKDFPYAIRLVSEITESNGSSSMATVCGGSLALMDSGVPISSPVAGIAMGLIKEEDKFIILSDILGDEDHLGDMDFKVAGTKDGITALQMDIKIDGITVEIMQKALEQAKHGRMHILGRISAAIPEARKELNENAPQIISIKIDKDKIGSLIGPGGKTIKEICDTTSAKIDIDEDGTVNVISANSTALKEALEMVQAAVAEVEQNKIYDAKIVKLLDFGALAKFLGKFEGLIHISELNGERVDQVSDVVSEGQDVKVKVLTVNDRGKVRLSLKRVNQETGDDISDQFPEDDYAPRERRGGPQNRRRSNNGPKRSSGNNYDDNHIDNDNHGNTDSSNKGGDKRKKRFF